MVTNGQKEGPILRETGPLDRLLPGQMFASIWLPKTQVGTTRAQVADLSSHPGHFRNFSRI